MTYEQFEPAVRNEQIVGKAKWDDSTSEDFARFVEVNNVDIVRIASPHDCKEAIVVAFLKEEPESARQITIAAYRDQMVYYCKCGKGKFNQAISE